MVAKSSERWVAPSQILLSRVRSDQLRSQDLSQVTTQTRTQTSYCRDTLTIALMIALLRLLPLLLHPTFTSRSRLMYTISSGLDASSGSLGS
jgi:hypothetical protein